MEEVRDFSDLARNIQNMEIALMAINSRLSLVEAFNSQLAQGQIDTKDVLTKLIRGGQQTQDQAELRETFSELVKTVNQMKVTQNMLMMRLK
ncbi:hypothetical protein [Noviherbaspirillum pedocola]|uniref:Uncharacterized protein n=1 Tax=Noviherbaspirillum pedocola TaxID=2801341 RepID=A0A934SQN9_9BURK|nr:hypothetical protein [Noviherbaspirillum pedocola]MBK4733699.1 hypothetical protein [Noviherbaspirillum pedocola]